MINEKGEKVLLFCDNPACFATHLAKKHIQEDKELKKEKEVEE